MSRNSDDGGGFSWWWIIFGLWFFGFCDKDGGEKVATHVNQVKVAVESEISDETKAAISKIAEDAKAIGEQIKRDIDRANKKSSTVEINTVETNVIVPEEKAATDEDIEEATRIENEAIESQPVNTVTNTGVTDGMILTPKLD